MLPTPRCLSQVAASFFGSWCLGIHLGPLLACSTYNHSSVAGSGSLAESGQMVTSQLKEDPVFAFYSHYCEDLDDLFGYVNVLAEMSGLRTADPLLAKQVLSQPFHRAR